jgi:hypothetical protein
MHRLLILYFEYFIKKNILCPCAGCRVFLPMLYLVAAVSPQRRLSPFLPAKGLPRSLVHLYTSFPTHCPCVKVGLVIEGILRHELLESVAGAAGHKRRGWRRSGGVQELPSGLSDHLALKALQSYPRRVAVEAPCFATAAIGSWPILWSACSLSWSTVSVPRPNARRHTLVFLRWGFGTAKKYMQSRARTRPVDADVPMDGVMRDL